MTLVLGESLGKKSFIAFTTRPDETSRFDSHIDCRQPRGHSKSSSFQDSAWLADNTHHHRICYLRKPPPPFRPVPRLQALLRPAAAGRPSADTQERLCRASRVRPEVAAGRVGPASPERSYTAPPYGGRLHVEVRLCCRAARQRERNRHDAVAPSHGTHFHG